MERRARAASAIRLRFGGPSARLSSALLALALFAANPTADSHGVNRQQAPLFRSDSEFVQVDAVVVDKDGNTIRGLTKDDFIVTDRKMPQAIATFVETSRDYDTSEAALPPSWPRDVASNTTPSASRLVVLAIDDMVPADRFDTVKAIARQVVNEVGDGAAMALLSVSEAFKVEVTENRALLLSEIDKISSRSAKAPRVARQTAVETGSCAFTEMMQLAQMLGSSDTQHRAVIYISPYCSGDVKELIRLMQAGLSKTGDEAIPMVEAFRKANVAFYAIDPRGPADYSLGHFDVPNILGEPGPAGMREMQLARMQCVLRSCDPVLLSQDNMREVSAATGGFAITNKDDIPAGITRIVDDFDHYYTLGFYATDPNDKSYRPIDVIVNRPGVTVRHRLGYQISGAVAKPKNKDPMVELSTGVMPKTDLPLRLFVMPTPSSPKLSHVIVALDVEAPPGNSAGVSRDDLDITILAVDLQKTKVTSEFQRPRHLLLPLTRAGTAPTNASYEIVTMVDVAPGSYQLRVSAKSSGFSKSGSIYASVDVPDYAKAPLSVGSLVVGYADPKRHPTSTSVIDPGTLPFEPVMTRAFNRDDELRLFCDIWRAAPFKATSTRLELLDASDRVVSSTDEQQPAGRAGTPPAYLDVTLPLKTLSAGAYQVRVTATDGTNRDSRSVGFTVK